MSNPTRSYNQWIAPVVQAGTVTINSASVYRDSDITLPAGAYTVQALLTESNTTVFLKIGTTVSTAMSTSSGVQDLKVLLTVPTIIQARRQSGGSSTVVKFSVGYTV